MKKDNDQKANNSMTMPCGCVKEGEMRKTVRNEKEKHYLDGRLNRVIGQLGGVKRMIDEDRYCEDVLMQLSAIDSAVKSISTYILEQHMRGCVVRDIKAGEEGSVDEVLMLFKRFMR